MRAVADVATPETDEELLDQAKECTVRQLADVARTKAAPQAPSASSEHDRRFLRFNDTFRTVSVQLPPESFASTRACLEARARSVPSDGETPWDQRLCDAFVEVIRSSGGQRATTASPYVVVAHVPLEALVDNAGESSDLAGELERDGLISAETVKQIACDATIVIGVDDDVGHTMYEGRARRTPSEAQRREIMRRDRHCRFPGCSNVTFTNVHHIVHWKPGGRTDLDNLALTCLYHHHLVHSKGWVMTGNANEELTFTSPKGRVMTSRPSPLWARAGDGQSAIGAAELNPRSVKGWGPSSWVHPLDPAAGQYCAAMPFHDVNGVSLYYELTGAGERLLSISGTGGDLRQKPGVADGPVGQAFEVLSYDQRGLGQSSVPPWPYAMADFADDAVSLLDAVGWDDCLVLGISFGGMVAQEVAIRHPERVRRLVLACTSAGGAGGASYPLQELATLGPEEGSARRMEILDTRWDAALARREPRDGGAHRRTHARANGGAARPGPDQPVGRPGRTRHRGPSGCHRVPNPGVRREVRRDRAAVQQRVPGVEHPAGTARDVRRRPCLLLARPRCPSRHCRLPVRGRAGMARAVDCVPWT